MTRSFWRGIVAGGFIGGLVSRLFSSPQKKVFEDKQMKKQMGQMKVQAQKVMEEAKDGLKDFYRKK